MMTSFFIKEGSKTIFTYSIIALLHPINLAVSYQIYYNY